jgi:hypothetical protein
MSIPWPPIGGGILYFENSEAIIRLLITSLSPPYPPYFFGTDLAK